MRNLKKNRYIEVEEVFKDELNLRKLLAGRIDLFPLEREVGYHLLKTKFSSKEMAKVTYHPKPLGIDGYYLILSKNDKRNKKMMEIFDKGMNELKAKGRLKKF